MYGVPAEEAGHEVVGGAQEAPVDVATAYTGFSVSLPKVGSLRKQHDEAGWESTYDTQVLPFEESNAGRLERTLAKGEHT